MKIALDPYMLRFTPLEELPSLVASIGFSEIELSPRRELMPFYVRPRASHETIGRFRKALSAARVGVAAVLIGDYRWSSPDEAERSAAVRYWKAAIEVTAEFECPIIAAEFGGLPHEALASEASFWKSIDELLPFLEARGITLTLEPHPYNFVEDNTGGVDLVRAIDSSSVGYLYCAPHTFHLGTDIAAMLRYAAPVLKHVHVADVLNHRASSGNRFIVNPPGTQVRVHQHLNIGEGEVDWDAFFRTLHEVGFDGLMTSSVFAWEDRAVDSCRLMRQAIDRYVGRYWGD